MKNLRLPEIGVLLYRIGLVFVFFQIARLLFWWFNRDIIPIDTLADYLALAYYGTAFDTAAILYVNALFILLSILPLVVNTQKSYQKILFWLYFITNSVAYLMNFGDFIYYRFSQSRLTSAVFQVVENEGNLAKVFLFSVVQNPMVAVGYVLLMSLWVFLYKKLKISEQKPTNKVSYFVSSVLLIIVVGTLAVGGIRGDFRHSTRPINMVDASRHTKNPLHANVVLNSTFSFFRTLGKKGFKEVHLVEKSFVEQNIASYKLYPNPLPKPLPNIVILIVESMGREYIGAFNEGKNFKNYQSYTPFLDSLAKESLIFPNTFANGRQSIHGMSSILAGIPALKDAFTGSPYAYQEIQSIVSVCNEMGYDTSFYHGAPNGSMGFQGFGNILGFKDYFGKTEYNNDADWDGIWAIWDEPFMQYFAKNVGKKQPFMATLFTASSHHPFNIPDKYKGKFKKGFVEIHEPIQYTDMALKKYFETAKKQDWYANTIFVITADHPNQIHEPEYQKAMNRFAVPLLFYSPNPTYGLKGVNEEFAQQMDIYPSLADLIGYPKRIRSWGRSIFSSEKGSHFIVNSDGLQEQFIIGNYIYTFNGKEITGVYHNTDLGLAKNLIGNSENTEIQHGKKLAMAWYQDYMDRVMNRKLH